MAIGLQEGFLINVLRLGFRAGQMHGQAQHRLVVLAHQLLKRSAGAALRLAYQIGIVDAVECVAHHRTPGRAQRRDNSVLSSLHSPRLTNSRHG